MFSFRHRRTRTPAAPTPAPCHTLAIVDIRHVPDVTAELLTGNNSTVCEPDAGCVGLTARS